MTADGVRTGERGRDGARDIAVWDPLVRLVHWTLAIAILTNGLLLDTESEAHEWVGYLALTLVGLRLFWGLIGTGHARFAAFPPLPGRALGHLRGLLSGDRRVHLSHNPLGALMVYNLWLSVIGMGVTGYMMTTVAFFGVDWVKELHEALFNWILVSVALHVAGVVFDSRRTGVNLVRAMLTGRKAIPAGREVE
ncbi:cytochrome b/b6 domain-containing protein [Albidovulum sp.]